MIRDDDYQSGSILSIDDASVPEGDAGETTADFVVTLTPAASVTVKVEVKGQAGDDLLYGEADGDRLVGGTETLSGATGDDLLIGGLKRHLGTFVNVLDGGAGSDQCRREASATDCEP